LANANCDDGLPPSLLREISILRTLTPHPNINPLTEVDINPSKPVVDLVYEYHPQSLKDLLRTKRPESSDLRIIYQIALSLQFLHSNG
jgi:serine/threonine protein kinase